MASNISQLPKNVPAKSLPLFGDDLKKINQQHKQCSDKNQVSQTTLMKSTGRTKATVMIKTQRQGYPQWSIFLQREGEISRATNTFQKIKFCLKYFLSKYDQILKKKCELIQLFAWCKSSFFYISAWTALTQHSMFCW